MSVMTYDLSNKIEHLKNKADALRPLKPEDEHRLWKKFRLDWNYNSNHLEGNTLTYEQTELLLIFDRATGEHDLREFEEMKAHDVAIKMVNELANDSERPLTESFIRRLNEVILVRPFWKDAQTSGGQATRKEIKIGEYKSMPNSVRLKNGEMFHYSSPEETPALMYDLMNWYNDNTNLHPVELAAWFHYKFIVIHPFDDGNGRVARLIMNYILIKAGYPPAVVKSKDKAKYIDALNKADAGNTPAFVNYIAEQLVWSLDTTLKAATGQSIDEPEDLDKKLEQLNREIADKLVIVEKSNEQVARILKEVYLPLIQHTYKRVQKMTYLFKGIGLAYFQEPEELGGNIPLNASAAASIESLFEYFLTIAREKGSSYHRFKTGIWLVDYTKSMHKFSIEVSFRIYFDKFDYHIESSVSQPYASGFLTQQFVGLMKKIDNNLPTDDFDLTKVAVGKWKYLEEVTDNFLQVKADEIANRAFEFMEEKIKKLKD